MKRMNRKAQFYILAAVVLLSITFGIFTPKKSVSRPAKVFNLLAENYVKEAPFAANYGSIEDFTLKFYSYALTVDSDFEMLSLLVSSDNVSALSLIRSTIFINQHGLSFNESAVLEKEDSVTVSIGGSQYIIDTSREGVRAVFISEKAGSRRVRVE